MTMKPLDRRHFLRLTALGGLGASLPFGGEAFAQTPAKPDRFVVNGSGGAMGAAMEKAYGSVFLDKTGIKMQLTSPPDMGKLKAMVETGNVESDVTELNSADARVAGRQGLLIPIDDKIVDRSRYPADAKDPNVLTAAVYSTNLAYRADAFPGEKPKTWADFWDVKKFPGARALWNSPIDNLEFALLADGVDPAKLYPLDVDRAFAKLDQIKKHVTAYWESGAQQIQMLTDSEVVLSSAWNGRVMTAAKAGHPIEISWNGAVIKQFYVGIPRGVKSPYWSQQFLAAMTDPKAQSIFANTFAAPGLNPDSNQYTDAAVRPYMPTEPDHMKLAFWQDDVWWNGNVAELKQRWQRWMVG